MRTLRLPTVDGTDAPANLNGRVRFAERRNLVSERVPSRFERSLALNAVANHRLTTSGTSRVVEGKEKYTGDCKKKLCFAEDKTGERCLRAKFE
jgi:hypothetical protein